MATVEVSRTLVKSPPELWAELEHDGLAGAVDGARVRATEPERELSFEAAGASGTVRLEPSSWGTKVTVRAVLEDDHAHPARFSRWRRAKPPAATHGDLETRLSDMLDALGQAHRKPFARD